MNFSDVPSSEPIDRALFCQPILLVGKPGLEPGRLSAHDPKSCSSTSSDTSPQSDVKIGEPSSLHCSHLSFKPQRKNSRRSFVSIAIVPQPVHIYLAFSGPWSTPAAGGYSTSRRHNAPPNVPKKANNANTNAKIPNNELPSLPGPPSGPVRPCEPVEPGTPAGPVAPAEPGGPPTPGGPEGPCTPWDPCGPEGPEGPEGPASPLSPTTKTGVAVAAVVA